jgi:hypothetical protein
VKQDNFNLWMMWLHDLGGSFKPYRDDPPTEPRTPRTPRHRLSLRPLDPKKYYRSEGGQVRKHPPLLVTLREEVEVDGSQ